MKPLTKNQKEGVKALVIILLIILGIIFIFKLLNNKTIKEDRKTREANITKIVFVIEQKSETNKSNYEEDVKDNEDNLMFLKNLKNEYYNSDIFLNITEEYKILKKSKVGDYFNIKGKDSEKNISVYIGKYAKCNGCEIKRSGRYFGRYKKIKDICLKKSPKLKPNMFLEITKREYKNKIVSQFLYKHLESNREKIYFDDFKGMSKTFSNKEKIKMFLLIVSREDLILKINGIRGLNQNIIINNYGRNPVYLNIPKGLDSGEYSILLKLYDMNGNIQSRRECKFKII